MIDRNDLTLVHRTPAYLTALVETDFIQPGDMVCHRSGSLQSPAIRLSQTLSLIDFHNDKKHPRRGRISWKDAWYWGGFTHISCVDSHAGQITEMTSPHAGCRTFEELRGETLLICRPLLPDYLRELTALNMAEVARLQRPYPHRELVANTRHLARVLKKVMGHERFDRVFDDPNANVCGGTYVGDGLLQACQGVYGCDHDALRVLRGEPVTALYPARLASMGKPVFRPVILVKIF